MLQRGGVAARRDAKRGRSAGFVYFIYLFIFAAFAYKRAHIAYTVYTVYITHTRDNKTPQGQILKLASST